MARKRTSSFSRTRKQTVQSLPFLLQLIVFIMLALLAVVSLNFEIFRVVRLGDLFIILFAFMVGVNWYGQKMLDEGYKNALRESAPATKSKRK